MPISKQGGNILVFDNATENQASADYEFKGGLLQVDIFGTLDGSDVATFYRGAKGQPVRIRDLSWLSSDQDVLTPTDGGVIEMARPAIILFQITNAGASTNISLNAFPLGEATT